MHVHHFDIVYLLNGHRAFRFKRPPHYTKIVVVELSARLLWTMRRELQSLNEQAIRLRSEKHK